MSDHGFEEPAFEEPADPVPRDQMPRDQMARDQAFNDLVARFDEMPGHSTWPAAEDLQPPGRPPAIASRTHPGVPATDGGAVADGDARTGDLDPPTETDLTILDPVDPGAGGHRRDDPDSDHYIPPPAPPAPPLRPATRAALATLAIGVVLLVGPALSGRNTPVSVDALAVLFVLGGVGTLVARMRETRSGGEDGDDWDDGAVV
jgi:hypothetical protein